MLPIKKAYQLLLNADRAFAQRRHGMCKCHPSPFNNSSKTQSARCFEPAPWRKQRLQVLKKEGLAPTRAEELETDKPLGS